MILCERRKKLQLQYAAKGSQPNALPPAVILLTNNEQQKPNTEHFEISKFYGSPGL